MVTQRIPKDIGSVTREEKQKCPECGGIMEYEKGEFVCTKCGLVQD